MLTWCGKSQGSAGGCGWTVWDGGGMTNKVAGASDVVVDVVVVL